MFQFFTITSLFPFSNQTLSSLFPTCSPEIETHGNHQQHNQAVWTCQSSNSVLVFPHFLFFFCSFLYCHNFFLFVLRRAFLPGDRWPAGGAPRLALKTTQPYHRALFLSSYDFYLLIFVFILSFFIPFFPPDRLSVAASNSSGCGCYI